MVHAQLSMAADDSSLPNFDDLSDTSYTGLTDTAESFSGSSTLQDVSLGSPLQLDTSYGDDDVSSTPDLWDLDGMSEATASQTLSGVADPPFASAAQSTPTPNVAQPSASSAAGLSALSKFGAGLATLFAAPAKQIGPSATLATTAGGARPIAPGVTGTNTIMLLVVVAALIILLARGE